MGIDDTAGPTVAAVGLEDGVPPLGIPAPEPRPEVPRRWIVAAVVSGIALIALMVVMFGDAEWIGQDDYVLAPGSASDTVSAVEVRGADTFVPDGEIDFTTVSIRRDVTIWEWWRARRSSTSELVPPEQIDGERTSDETRQITQFQMNQSQDAAVQVALQYLGYELVPEIEGAFVVALVPGSPADAQLHLGDLVTEVDGTAIRSSEDLADTIGALQPGATVTLLVHRAATDLSTDGADPDAVEESVEVVLAENDRAPGTGFLGVSIETPMRVDAPFDVAIDVGRVRGPSAGLAFSLAILDVLTEGELTGGHHVATTGTIDRNGIVGPVGGVPQKVAAARREGVEVFLVPPFELADAVDAAGDDLEVRCVQTFGDAVLVLAEEFGGNGVEVARAIGRPAPERSPEPVDPDDGYLSCAEARAEIAAAATAATP